MFIVLLILALLMVVGDWAASPAAKAKSAECAIHKWQYDEKGEMRCSICAYKAGS